MSYKKQVFKVSYIAILGNVLLSILKLSAGILGHSQAMISDAFHSISDVLSAFVVMIGVFFARKDADKEHPYGYERIESIASFILAFVLAGTGLYIGYQGIIGLFVTKDFQVPTLFPLIISIVAILYKEGMYRYTKMVAMKIKSNSLMAEAWHHRTDAMASIGGFIGILGAILGFPKLDVIASIIICLFILKVAYDIFLDSIQKMIDHACGDTMLNKMKSLILSIDGVLGIDSLKTRMFGNRIYCDVEISCHKKTNFEQAHSIAHQVHDTLEENISDIKHCMVHVNPK